MIFNQNTNKEIELLKNKLTNFCFYNLNIMKIEYISDDLLIIIRNLLLDNLLNKYYYLNKLKISSSLYYRDNIWTEAPCKKLIKLEKEIDKYKSKNKIDKYIN